MELYNASSETVEYPEIRIDKYTKDFSWGFYCTNNYNQAKKWAIRHNGKIVNKYEYEENKELNIKKFNNVDSEWLDFIVECRSGKTHNFDIVEGPMADDTIWNYINDYIEGKIDKEQFFVLMKFKYPTHQISFHTLKALECLKFKNSEVIND
jgi:hypothetical protein